MGNGVLAYIIVMSLILFILMGVDKSKAKKHEWRISEKTLFTLAILGGAPGGILGMYFFHHKTKHLSFVFVFPLLTVIQIFIVIKLFTQ